MLGGMLISWMQKSEIEILSQIGYGIENISEFLVTIVIVASFFGPIIAIIYLLIFN
jgi:MFS-type transporter involved in bile tolerance (Atg22 family)